MAASEQQLGPAVARTLLDYARNAAKYGPKLKAWHIIIKLECDDGESSQIARENNGFERDELQTLLFNASLTHALETLSVMRERVELDSTPEDD